jgi:hypothetical protein
MKRPARSPTRSARRLAPEDREAVSRAARWLEVLLSRGERASSKDTDHASDRRDASPTRNRHQGNQ